MGNGSILGRARSALGLGRLKIMEAVDPDPLSISPATAAFFEGVVIWRQGRTAEAIERLEQVLDGAFGPVDDALRRKVLSRLLVFAPTESWAKAEALALEAVRVFPQEAFGWLHLGEALIQQDRHEEAETRLLKAIEIDPAADDARLLLVMARRRMNPSAVTAKRPKPRPWPDRQHLFDDPRHLLERYLLRGYPAEPFVRAGTTFMTLGSCFAENLARRLAAEGYPVHSEPIGEEVNSTWANRFLLKWVEEGAVDGPTRVIDEVYGPQRRERLRAGIIASDVLVLTLGVAPCFFDRETGEFAFSNMSSHTGHQYLQRQCVMRTTTVAENVANLVEILAAADRIAGRPHRFVLTVSPVALAATTEFYSAVIADCLSKSTLRLACQDLIQARPELIYWPSFEIVRWLGVHYTRPEAPVFGADDGNTRHVSTWLVELIVRLFLDRHRVVDEGETPD